MTENDLKRLGRKELIEIIVTLKKNESELVRRLELAEKQLADRTINIANAGSIAEAALSLSGIFEAAQKAADTYLQSIHTANADMELRIQQTKEECARLLRGAEQEAIARIQDADQQCVQKVADTDAAIEKKWGIFHTNVQKVLEAHSELSNYLQDTI